MARSVWKGLVNFGLVNIPVELHPGVREHRPRFRLLHRKDLSPIRQERVCQLDGDVVAWEDLVKGYEVERGRFVTVTEDDFKTAALERSRSIDIIEFVKVSEIDVRYWETPVRRAARARGPSIPTPCWPRRSATAAAPASPSTSCASGSTWRPSRSSTAR